MDEASVRVNELSGRPPVIPPRFRLDDKTRLMNNEPRDDVRSAQRAREMTTVLVLWYP